MGTNYSQATSAQLKAEISGSGRTMRSLAEEMGVDYTSFTRRLKGERTLRLMDVYEILAVLHIEPGQFFTHVQERADAAQSQE